MLTNELNNIVNLFYANVTSYKTIQSYITELLKLFKTKSLKKFKQKDIEKYLTYLKVKQNKNTTINAKLSFLSKCLKYYQVNLIIPYQKITQKNKNIIDKSKFNDLINKVVNSNSILKSEILKFLQIAFYTGLRANEILNIRVQHIKQINNSWFINIYDTKNHQDNLIPVHKNLIPIITHFKEFAIKYNQLYYELKKLDINPHQFRHSFITHCFESGLDIFTVMRLVNHKSLNSTKKYIHLQNTFLTKELERIHYG